MSLEPLGIPRELLIFCLHWNREEVGSRTSEGRPQDTAGQMTLPARVEGKGLPCPFMWAVTESLAQIQGGSLYLNDLIKNNPSARWWWRHIPVISALGRPRQEDLCEFEPGLCCETLSWQKRGKGKRRRRKRIIPYSMPAAWVSADYKYSEVNNQDQSSLQKEHSDSSCPRRGGEGGRLPQAYS